MDGRPNYNADGTLLQAASRPALRARTPLSLRDISPHCGESPFAQGSRYSIIHSVYCRGEHCSPANFAITQTSTGAHCAPLHPLSPYRESRPRRGQSGEGPKSVKKNAVIPAFFSFWVLRPPLWGSKGAGPLGRGSLPRNSETFFATFLVTKKVGLTGATHYKKGHRKVVALAGLPSRSTKAKAHQSAAFIKAYPSGSSRLNATLSR